MKSVELRQKFLKFFEEKEHKIIPSTSLVPSENVELTGTQRVLFTTAGMHPLIPYLLGEVHPEGKRLASVQKCLRTDDIDEVGDAVHNTFFEMLGNWSLGDYWKEETIAWSWEFLIKVLNLEKERIYISVFAGDKDAPFDQESFDVWKKLGVADNHIFKYGKKENWWGPVGETGPCGPDTEMFYDVKGGDLNGKDPAANPERFIEVWNDVFMQYDKKIKNQKPRTKNVEKLTQDDVEYFPLKQRNVDTGMGLERMLLALNNTPSIYETGVFTPLVEKIKSLAQKSEERPTRIVADHLRASVFLLADGVKPANVERGYVLRRLIRRAIRNGQLLQIEQNFLETGAKTVIETNQSFYPELAQNQEMILTELANEEARFKKALTIGLAKLWQIKGDISGKAAFDLYQSFGFPIELTEELAAEQRKKVDVVDFHKLLKEHQELSRKASTKAAGGLAEQSEMAILGHTATHLLHQALRDILGDQVHQTGSNITAERIRFDFAHDQPLTEEQLKNVEEIVNQRIKQNLKLRREFMSQEEADRIGAVGLFKEKYGDKVSIYKIGDYSVEYCAGPHAASTGSLQSFKIVKEESVGARLRRIYAKLRRQV